MRLARGFASGQRVVRKWTAQVGDEVGARALFGDAGESHRVAGDDPRRVAQPGVERDRADQSRRGSKGHGDPHRQVAAEVMAPLADAA